MQSHTSTQTTLQHGQLPGSLQQSLKVCHPYSHTAGQANTSGQPGRLVQAHRNPPREFCSVSRSVSVARARICAAKPRQCCGCSSAVPSAAPHPDPRAQDQGCWQSHGHTHGCPVYLTLCRQGQSVPPAQSPVRSARRAEQRWHSAEG